MEELRDLNQMANKASLLISKYEGVDFELPQLFKDRVTEINSNSIKYNQYSAIIETKGYQNGTLNIYMPNQWFCVASYFTELYNELMKYKRCALKIANKDRLKTLNGSTLDSAETEGINKLDITPDSKVFLIKFITEYSWWGGAKTIDRGDFFVSPILSHAKLVNASQSFVADLCAFLADKQELVEAIINHVDTGHHTTGFSIGVKSPLQQIFYGAPGTGKSHTIDEDTNEDNRIRTTFHPDYDYATFVGAYKPTVKPEDRYGLFGKDSVKMKDEKGTEIKDYIIVYKFIPQAFIKAYVEAWRRYANAECTDKDFYLVIEEINRGNCAQIFGDLFQLLDRTNAGFSSYAVETESDLQDFLTNDEKYKLDIVLTEDIKNDNGKVIATAKNVMNGKVLVLPPNLHIWATMNTSDQSLFPIDSAFKRRWDWKYVPIKYDNTDWKVVLGDKEVCKWTDLQQTLNDLIYDATESEDKMLGDWFVKADSKNEINEEQLVGKIVFYLWNDVAKVDAGRLFDLEVEKNGRKRKVIFSDFYTIDGKVNAKIVEDWLKNINVLKGETVEDSEPIEPEL